MGAGIVECDVTFTKDGQLVCRHAECDLHTTTNIVATPLNKPSATVPWTRGRRAGPSPEVLHQRPDPGRVQDAPGKMDASNPGRHDAGRLPRRHAELAHRPLHRPRHADDAASESIELNQENGVKHTPELKGGDPARIDAGLRRPGAVRAEDDRRAAGRRRRSAGRLAAVLQQRRRPVLDRHEHAVRQAGGVPRRHRRRPLRRRSRG